MYLKPMNMYSLNFSGCIPCNCNEHGSSSLQCNEDGTCNCKTESGGEKCEFCSEEQKLWGLPVRPCEGECVSRVDPLLAVRVRILSLLGGRVVTVVNLVFFL